MKVKYIKTRQTVAENDFKGGSYEFGDLICHCMTVYLSEPVKDSNLINTYQYRLTDMSKEDEEHIRADATYDEINEWVRDTVKNDL